MRGRRLLLTAPLRSDVWPRCVFALPRRAPICRCLHVSPLLWSTGKVLAPPTSIQRTTVAPGPQSRTATPPSKKKTHSPEEELLRRVNTLVSRRDAAGAVTVMKQALDGAWPLSSSPSPPPPPQQQQLSAAGISPSLQLTPSTRSSSRGAVVFSSKALAATLHACDATGAAAEGLSLVAEVRRRGHAIAADWLKSEHVLFAILRLQCAAGDRKGATHMFAYLEQHGLLRLRSASLFISYCCNSLHDRRLAFAAYEKALQHKMELTEPDYVALGQLCVRVGEPVSTLVFLLEEMKEHVTEVSGSFVNEVLQPWVACANTSGKTSKQDERQRPQYRLAVVEKMRRMNAMSEDVALSCHSSTSSTSCGEHLSSDSSRHVKERGVCPVCDATLSGHAFTTACRAHLLQELRDVVIPQACRSRRALQGFEHWRRYIHARHDTGDHVDVFIDGANLGYYGLSSWYDIAKRELLLHRGVPASQITAEELNFDAQCKASGKGVDVGVNFTLIDAAVTLAVARYGLSRPLVMLHERHVEPRFMTPQSSAIVERWRAQGWLYCSPTGLNDDLCWLYGALLMADPTDRVASPDTAVHTHRTLVCTNDKMRDHHFRLLSPRAFTRWRDRHRIAFRCARVGDHTEVHWELPAPYERCVQRHDWTPEERRRYEQSGHCGGGGGGGAGDRVPVVSWHIPFSRHDKCAEASDAAALTGEGKQVDRPRSSEGAQANGDAPLSNVGDGAADGGESTEMGGSLDTATASTWVCFTVTV